MRILFVYWGIMLEENVVSTLHSMMKWNSFSEPSSAFRKAALHEPSEVARVEFAEYEAMTRRQVSSIGGSVYARCLELYPSTAGWYLIERSDFMEMILRLPACWSRGNQYWTRKRFWSASQIVCLLGNHDGGERSLHATFHDEIKQFIRPNSGFA